MTLRELIEAYKNEDQSSSMRLSPLMIDNDITSVELHDEEWENVEDVFAMDPQDLLWELLDLVGIPHEHV